MTKHLSINKILEKKCIEKNIPFHVGFELTYQCNLSCKHCYLTKSKQKELSLDEIKAILDQLVEAGTMNLIFTGGEIFTRNDFFDIAKYARKRGFSLILLTNGTLITKKVADELKSLKPVGVEISLQGCNSATHDHITNMPGSFDRTIEAIRLLVERNIFVLTKTTLMKMNVREYKAIKALVEDIGACHNIGLGIIPRKDGSVDPQAYELSWDERIKYVSAEDLRMSCLPEGIDPLSKLICRAGKAVAAISPYGDVQPCILMPITLGNLRSEKFGEIWHSNGNNILKRLRAITASDLTTCLKCKNMAFCVRCPGVAYLETHNLFSPSPTACENARWRGYHANLNSKGGE